MKHKLYPLPSGLVGVAVSTRDDPRRFNDRPFQVSIAPQPKTCPYEPGKQPDLEVGTNEAGSWVVVKHPIPFADPCYFVKKRTCSGMNEDDVRNLGGTLAIQNALELLEELRSQHMQGRQAVILVHAEASGADGRSGHLGWHIHPEPEPVPSSTMLKNLNWMKASRLSILDYKHVIGKVGGFLDGQVNFYSPSQKSFKTLVERGALSDWLRLLIELYGNRFRSKQGMLPDFSLEIRVGTDGQFVFGMFLPKLRHLGAYEFAAITQGCNFGLGCSWEAMHRYLTKE